MSRLAMAVLAVAALVLVGAGPPRPSARVDGDDSLRRASVDGKYRVLLKVISVPNDRVSYTAFRDWGLYTGTSYAGYDNLPPGYWVYVYPRWYIWRDGP